VTASYDRTLQIWYVWLNFEDPKLLGDMAEAVGGFSYAEERRANEVLVF
jgi:hypothetical protein